MAMTILKTRLTLTMNLEGVLTNSDMEALMMKNLMKKRTAGPMRMPRPSLLGHCTENN